MDRREPDSAFIVVSDQSVCSPTTVRPPGPSRMKVRVVHVTWGRCNPESANGVDKSVYHLAHAQAALGADVTVLAVTTKEAIPIPGVKVRAVSPPRRWVTRLKLPIASGDMLRAVLSLSPEMVHFHSLHLGSFVGLGRVLRSSGIPYVVTPHGALASGRLRGRRLVRTYVSKIERPFLENAAFVHVVSGADATGLDLLGIDAETVRASNGVDLRNAGVGAASDYLAERLPELQGRRVLLFLGRLDMKTKGLDLLLEGFARARPAGWVLVMVGPSVGRTAEQLRRRAYRLGVGDDVFVLGKVSGGSKWATLASGEVFVHPSRSEGSPVSVLEALARGLPVIVTAVADPEGRVQSAECGLVVEPSATAVAEAIARMCSVGKQELAAMGARARDVAASYDWTMTARRLLEAYRERG